MEQEMAAGRRVTGDGTLRRVGAGRGHPPLPPGLPARLRRLPGRALLHRLRAATRLGLRRSPAARGVGRVAGGPRHGGVAPRAARGGGAGDGRDGVARRPDRPGPGRWALRRRPGRTRHRPRPGRPVSRQHLLDERLRPPLLGAHRLDPRARPLRRARAAVAGLRRRGWPRPSQQDQHPLPRLRSRGRARARPPMGRLPLAPLLGGRPPGLRDLPAASSLAARERLADARVHGERAAPQDGAALGAGLREGGPAPDGADGLALGRRRRVAPPRSRLLARARPRLRVPGRGWRPRVWRRQAVLPHRRVLAGVSPPARWRWRAGRSGGRAPCGRSLPCS